MKEIIRNCLLAVLLVFTVAAGVAEENPVTHNKKPLSSYEIQVDAGWNLLSVPLYAVDSATAVLFPTATSPAYTYQDSYVSQETLKTGYGYWLKFSSAQTITINGDTVSDKAIPVRTGWNMIGSHSVPVAVSTIQSEPPGIIASKFYRYAAVGGYQEADTIQPGFGFWVKVDQDGYIFLNAPYTSTATISDEARTVVLDSINAHINALTGVDRIADNLTILQYLRSIPEFEASDTIRGGVWARFTDGRLFMFANNLTPPPDSSSEIAIDKEIAQNDDQRVFTPTDNIPFYSGAWIVNALGPYFNPTFGPNSLSAAKTNNDLQQWFQSVGYTPLIQAGATVAHLKNVSSVGVFYMSTHGSYVRNRNSDIVFGIWTASKQSPLFDEVFKRELDQGELVYYSAPHNRLLLSPISETHYAVTAKFIRRYMSFSGRSIVFINGCGSVDAEIVDACFAKGADLFIGWDNETTTPHALRAARHLFDRLLGTNKENPENPPQRPFDINLVMDDLIHRKYDSSYTPEWGAAKLKFVPIIPYTNILVPSIFQAYKDPIPGSSDFYIDGLFGDDPGQGAATVKVGGTALGIRQWMNSTKLRLELPTHGGNVQVSVRGRKSNITQYTEYHAVFDYTLNGRGSLKQHIVMNVDFLADVHYARNYIAVPPIYPFPRFIQVLNTSHADYECSGEYRNPKDTAFVEEWWTGAGSVPLGSGPPGFGFSTLVGPPGNANFASLAFQAVFYINGFATPLNLNSDVTNFTLTLGAGPSFVIGGDTITGDDALGSVVMTWSDMTPVYPPDPNSAR